MAGFSGMNDLQRALKEASPLSIKGLAAGGLVHQEKVISKAKNRTPVESGTLRNSGDVLPAEISPNKVVIEAGFGGQASSYAIVVHEKMGVSHKSGQSKFLESAAVESDKAAGPLLAKAVELAWKSLGR